MRGTLSSASHVVVDIGTGFYVEKVISYTLHSTRVPFTIHTNLAVQEVKSAADFYENKVGEVGASIKDLEAIVQAKTSNVRVVEEGIYLPSSIISQKQQLTSRVFIII